MSKVLVNETSLENIGDAIRKKTGSTDTFKPSEMGAAIEAIAGEGGVVLPELTNPAAAENIQKGYEAVDGNGVKIVGTHEEAPELPELTNPAAAGDIPEGMEAIDANGNKLIGELFTVSGTQSLTMRSEKVTKQGEDLQVMSKPMDGDTLIRDGGKIGVRATLSDFGDATAADVLAGKTFTSAAGVKIAGLAEMEEEDMVLIWQNATPNSNFVSQTLPLDLTEFDAVHITVGEKHTTYTNTSVYAFATKQIGARIRDIYYDNTNSVRNITIDDNGVTFAGDATAYCIPYQIYGVKVVKRV